MKRFMPYAILFCLNLVHASGNEAIATPRRMTMLRCGEIGSEAPRDLRIDADAKGVLATLSGHDDDIRGIYQNGVFSFQSGKMLDDANFLSLEIRPVNKRDIGVLVEVVKDGSGTFKESYFTCADVTPGSASSNGG